MNHRCTFTKSMSMYTSTCGDMILSTALSMEGQNWAFKMQSPPKLCQISECKKGTIQTTLTGFYKVLYRQKIGEVRLIFWLIVQTPPRPWWSVYLRSVSIFKRGSSSGFVESPTLPLLLPVAPVEGTRLSSQKTCINWCNVLPCCWPTLHHRFKVTIAFYLIKF